MIADYLPHLFLAWSIQWVGIVAPGPSVMLILGVASAQGRSASMVTAFGIACGSLLLATATVLGISALVAQMADAMTVLRWLGAAYLAWLGFKSLKVAWKNPPLPTAAPLADRPLRTAFTGMMLQLTNPKAVGFWLAIASLGGAGDAPLPIIALFVAGAFINSFAGHGLYALVLSSPPIRRFYAEFRRWIEGLLGSLFLAASLRLALGR